MAEQIEQSPNSPPNCGDSSMKPLARNLTDEFTPVKRTIDEVADPSPDSDSKTAKPPLSPEGSGTSGRTYLHPDYLPPELITIIINNFHDSENRKLGFEKQFLKLRLLCRAWRGFINDFSLHPPLFNLYTWSNNAWFLCGQMQSKSDLKESKTWLAPPDVRFSSIKPNFDPETSRICNSPTRMELSNWLPVYVTPRLDRTKTKYSFKQFLLDYAALHDNLLDWLNYCNKDEVPMAKKLFLYREWFTRAKDCRSLTALIDACLIPLEFFNFASSSLAKDSAELGKKTKNEVTGEESVFHFQMEEFLTSRQRRVETIYKHPCSSFPCRQNDAQEALTTTGNAKLPNLPCFSHGYHWMIEHFGLSTWNDETPHSGSPCGVFLPVLEPAFSYDRASTPTFFCTRNESLAFYTSSSIMGSASRFMFLNLKEVFIRNFAHNSMCIEPNGLSRTLQIPKHEKRVCHYHFSVPDGTLEHMRNLEQKFYCRPEPSLDPLTSTSHEDFVKINQPLKQTKVHDSCFGPITTDLLEKQPRFCRDSTLEDSIGDSFFTQTFTQIGICCLRDNTSPGSNWNWRTRWTSMIQNDLEYNKLIARRFTGLLLGMCGCSKLSFENNPNNLFTFFWADTKKLLGIKPDYVSWFDIVVTSSPCGFVLQRTKLVEIHIKPAKWIHEISDPEAFRTCLKKAWEILSDVHNHKRLEKPGFSVFLEPEKLVLVWRSPTAGFWHKREWTFTNEKEEVEGHTIIEAIGVLIQDPYHHTKDSGVRIDRYPVERGLVGMLQLSTFWKDFSTFKAWNGLTRRVATMVWLMNENFIFSIQARKNYIFGIEFISKVFGKKFVDLMKEENPDYLEIFRNVSRMFSPRRKTLMGLHDELKLHTIRSEREVAEWLVDPALYTARVLMQKADTFCGKMRVLVNEGIELPKLFVVDVETWRVVTKELEPLDHRNGFLSLYHFWKMLGWWRLMEDWFGIPFLEDFLEKEKSHSPISAQRPYIASLKLYPDLYTIAVSPFTSISGLDFRLNTNQLHPTALALYEWAKTTKPPLTCWIRKQWELPTVPNSPEKADN